MQFHRDSHEKGMRKTRVAIAGIGGGGCNVLASLAKRWPNGPEMYGIHTDAAVLASSEGIRLVQIGEALLQGLSTGGKADMGRRAAERNRSDISAIFNGADLALLVTGLGGGTGTGAAPVIAEAAEDAGALVLCFVMLPFDFEGPHQLEQALQGLRDLRKVTDAVIQFPNQRVLEHADATLNVTDAFQVADRLVGDCIRSLWELFNRNSLIRLDFADFRTFLMNSEGSCAMACVESEGPSRVKDAVKNLLAAPQFENGAQIRRAGALLVGATGGPDLKLVELQSLLEEVREITSERTRILMGTAVDSDYQGKLSLSVLLAEERPEPEPAAATPAQTKTESEKSRKHKRSVPTQTTLDLDARGSGRFEDVTPTVYQGANLDVPTYVRRGIRLGR